MDSGAEQRWHPYFEVFNKGNLTLEVGRVTQVTGNLLKAFVPSATIGSICEVFSAYGAHSFEAEVIGFRDKNVLMMPLGEMFGVGLGSRVILKSRIATVKVAEELLGRVVDGMGQAIDHSLDFTSYRELPIYQPVINPMYRPPIHQTVDLGIRSINGLLTVGAGQRVGIMAGSGVGKSVLLGCLARFTNADINVIALIGERGREVREFIEHNLGPEGLAKSVLVVVTSDKSPLVRMRGAFVAVTIAEYFSSLGKNVLFIMDSVTRFAMAQREVGLNAGEPPASKGYTPSVFALLPKLLERVGTFEDQGSITGLFSVLVEGDDMDDPIADAVRSIVDGHIVLDRSLAQKGHFPAVDVLQSTSRLMRNIVSQEHHRIAGLLRENIAVYREAEDLINIGAYREGSNPRIDRAIQLHNEIDAFLKQDVSDRTSLEESLNRMKRIIG